MHPPASPDPSAPVLARPGSAAARPVPPDEPADVVARDHGTDEPARGLARPVLVAGILAGVVLRLVSLTGTLGRTDSDEVLSGLMAMHSPGSWPAFLWGQRYGGTLELGPLWVSTRLFGFNAVGLRLPVFLLTAATSVLVWRVARRLLDERGAQVAAVLSWVGPPTAVWYSTREMLFYQPTVFLGVLTVLFALRIIDRGPEAGTGLGDWAAMGLFAGLGWWTSPNTMYLVLPAGIALLVRRDRWVRPGWVKAIAVALVAFVAGALPWVVYNLGTGFSSLASEGHGVWGNYVTRLAWFLWFGLPGALGTRETFTYGFITPLAIVALVAFGAALVIAWRSASPRWQWDTIAPVAYPFCFAIVPFGPEQPNMKYQYFLTPILAVLFARLATSRKAAAVLVAVTVVVTGIGLQRIAAIGDEDGTPLLMTDLTEVIEVLDRERIDAVWGDYWIVYRLDWLTEERIAAAPSYGIPRHEPYEDRVRAADRSAWVTDDGDHEVVLREELTRLGVGFTETRAGAYVVFVPERPVLPEHLARRPGR